MLIIKKTVPLEKLEQNLGARALMGGRNGYPTVDGVFEERRVLLNQTARHEGTHRMSYQGHLFFSPQYIRESQCPRSIFTI